MGREGCFLGRQVLLGAAGMVDPANSASTNDPFDAATGQSIPTATIRAEGQVWVSHFTLEQFETQLGPIKV